MLLLLLLLLLGVSVHVSGRAAPIAPAGGVTVGEVLLEPALEVDGEVPGSADFGALGGARNAK